MIFMGYAFTGDPNALHSTPVHDMEFHSVSVGQGQVDSLLGSRDTLTDDEILGGEWNFDTVLKALFQGDVQAGNIDYAVSEIDKVYLKRRRQGDLDWITLSEKTITSPEDLAFIYEDKTAAADVYEYAVVPVIGGVESAPFVNSIDVKFNGMFILDATGVFSTELEIKCTTQANQPVSVITTLSRKHPYVIHNSSVRYDSGSVTGFFVEKQGDGYDTRSGYVYRKQLNEFLQNGLPKILKFDDGRMWIVDITSPQVVQNEQNHPEFVMTTFDWTETGDADNYTDLYNAGLIDGGGDN